MHCCHRDLSTIAKLEMKLQLFKTRVMANITGVIAQQTESSTVTTHKRRASVELQPPVQQKYMHIDTSLGHGREESDSRSCNKEEGSESGNKMERDSEKRLNVLRQRREVEMIMRGREEADMVQEGREKVEFITKRRDCIVREKEKE